ncbi:PLP-dependent aspartate aminotransferase family protein [Sphingosinicella sp. BN140058]|uniref:trans-sulfuration enzyme family protein n=1 Tax=Sphingosinicella sp. BN140058 TaxID=1892855 RepID=UPI0010123252|nr:PLP-dependent transferase [Sphingosinicella sp. BN140058]QAY76846.1 O-succinylhomoserine (thiol)-lyase [Sphingosinicella sp. BN140058]
MTQQRKPATIVAAARTDRDPAFASVAPPIWSSDTYRWEDADTKPGYDYSRTVSPNRDLLVEALAELEGAAGGVITGSGQSACLLAFLLLPAGAHVLAPHDCYGGTYRLIKGLEDQGKLRATFVDMLDAAAFERALKGGADLVWIETPSNPLLRITDIAARAAAAKQAGALVAADNTLLTPLRQKPLALGCDLVMHSTTKALNGHSDLFGGALLARDPALIEQMQWWSNAAGLNGSAFDSSQILRGLRTLPLRVRQQEESATRIASWLSEQPQVQAVNFPGLDSHEGAALAARQQSGPGFMISVRVKGDASRFLAALDLITLASSLGGFATLICKPATMTHRGMPPEAQAEAGIHPDLLRISVGLEDADDLIADLARGLAAL